MSILPEHYKTLDLLSAPLQQVLLDGMFQGMGGDEWWVAHVKPGDNRTKGDIFFLVLILATGGEVRPAGPRTSYMCRFARIVDVLRTTLEQHRPQNYLRATKADVTHPQASSVLHAYALCACAPAHCVHIRNRWTAGEVTPWLRVTATRDAQFSSGKTSPVTSRLLISPLTFSSLPSRNPRSSFLKYYPGEVNISIWLPQQLQKREWTC